MPPNGFGGEGRLSIEGTEGMTTPFASAIAGRAPQEGHSSDPAGTRAPQSGHSTSSSIACGGLKHMDGSFQYGYQEKTGLR